MSFLPMFRQFLTGSIRFFKSYDLITPVSMEAWETNVMDVLGRKVCAGCVVSNGSCVDMTRVVSLPRTEDGGL